MIMLSQPVTIEDWLGNVYLIKPLAMTPCMQDINHNSSVIFKKPRAAERKSKMIKRIMIATTIDKESISSLLRSLKQQLEVDLNLDNVAVFKMCSKGKLMDRLNDGDLVDRIINSHRTRFVDTDMSPAGEGSSKLESSATDCRETMSADSVVHRRVAKLTNISQLDLSANDTNRELDETKSAKRAERQLNGRVYAKATGNGAPKFTFFTCWYANEHTSKNYFLLPHDKVVNLNGQLPSYQVRESKRNLLTRYLKMIEKIAESRIKYKSIVASRRVEHLFYRKIVISARDRNGIWLSLQLLKEHLADVIRNAVFYQPSLQPNAIISPELLSELKNKSSSANNSDDRINFASENCFTDPLTFCKPSSKLSKIPVLLSQKYRFNITTNNNSRIKKHAAAVADPLPDLSASLTVNRRAKKPMKTFPTNRQSMLDVSG